MMASASMAASTATPASTSTAAVRTVVAVRLMEMLADQVKRSAVDARWPGRYRYAERGRGRRLLSQLLLLLLGLL